MHKERQLLSLDLYGGYAFVDYSGAIRLIEIVTKQYLRILQYTKKVARDQTYGLFQEK